MNFKRNMQVWAITIATMIIVGLPTTLIWGMNAQQTKRHIISKPVPSYNPTFEEYETTQRKYHNGIDGYIRLSPYYWGAATHTYRVAQTITGVLLGTEGTSINYITDYGSTSICQHGEYRHTSLCCFPEQYQPFK